MARWMLFFPYYFLNEVFKNFLSLFIGCAGSSLLPRLSLVAESVDYSLVVGHRLPIMAVSLMEHGLWVWASVAVTPCL